MLELLPHLTDGLRKLEIVVQVIYIGNEFLFYLSEEAEYETKRKEMCNITSLSLCDVYKFWKRIKCLWDELSTQGVNKKIVQVRSMVLALVTAQEMMYEVDVDGEREWKGIRIIAVDEKGKMINGRGEEMVQPLRQSDEEEEHHKLMEEIKSEGFSNVLGKRWAIHHKDHPHHPLVRVHHKDHPHHPLVRVHYRSVLKDGAIPQAKCDTCFQVMDYSRISYRCSICEKYEMRDYSRISYRCSICEKYEMCQKCFESC